MALILDRTPAGDAADDDAADDALQVVDLDDIVISSIEGPPPAHLHRRRWVRARKVVRLVLAFAFGMVLSVPIVAAIRWVQSDDDGSQVDIQDRHRELPADLEPPLRDDEPPVPEVDSPPTTPAPDATEADADPGGKSAFKDAAQRTPPPAAGPTAPATATTAPSSTTSTAPSTTAATTTTTPSVTLPDGSPNPLGPGPGGPTDTTMPDPTGPDYTVPG